MPVYHWLKYPFVRFAIAFLTGIVITKAGNFPIFYISIFAASSIVIALVLRISFFKNHGLFGLMILLVILSLGSLRFDLYNQVKWKTHFTNFNSTSYIGVVISNPKTTSNGSQGILSIDQVFDVNSWTNANGKIQAYFPSKVRYGDVVSFQKTPVNIERPLNPHQFDYKGYLANKNIFQQVFLSKGEFEIVGRKKPSYLISMSLVVRDIAISNLEKFNRIPGSLPVAKALLLGERASIPDELNRAYANAGVIHVLAVSGLHLGILYGLLIALFGRHQKKWWFVGLALFTMWAFAFIAGLPTSVIRAAFMFSILVIGSFLQRKTNIYNTLFLSALILMVVNPNVIFEVGFQLSYLAVLGIIISYGAIKNLFYIRIKILDKVWNLVAISIAAQLLTVPLLIYYFHNVSIVFFISNLVVVPLVTLVLVTGLLFFVLALIHLDFLATIISGVLDYLIEAMNISVEWIESIPWSYINGLTLNNAEIGIIYLAIAAIILFFVRRELQWLLLSTVAIVVYSLISVSNLENRYNQKQLVIYRTPGNSVLDYFDGNNIYNFEASESPFQTLNHRIYMAGGARIQKLQWAEIGLAGKLFIINGYKLMILDVKPEFNKPDVPVNADILVVSNNAIDDFETFKFFDAPLVLLDTSNDFWYALRAEEFLNDHGIKTVNIWNGAYIKNYN